MGIKKGIAIFTLLIAHFGLFAQNEGVNYQADYLRAKEHFRSQRWGLAQDSFEKLTQKSSDNPFSAYSSFYYALCAYHQGHYTLAKDMLLQIGFEYPNWHNADELNYWLSLMYFELGEYALAFSYGESLSYKDGPGEIRRMQQHYLQRIQSIDSVRALYEQFSDSYALGEYLALQIAQQNFLDQDLQLLSTLNEKFELGLDAKGSTKGYGPKESYEVAILFPFLSDEIDPGTMPKINQFVLDLYQGIRLAGDSLNSIGSQLNFSLFDTKRDSSVLRELLYDNRVITSDLIIGPLFFPDLISEFSLEHQVNVIHPYSKDQALIEHNPYFLLYSSLPTEVGFQAASYVLSDSSLKTGIIFYGEAERDSLMVRTFLDSLEGKDFNVILTKKIIQGEEREALKVLASGSVVNKLEMDEMVLPADSIDMIYVASTGAGGSLYSNILAGIEARGDSIRLLGSHNWIDDNVVNKSAFNRLPITLMGYDLIDYNDSTFYQFQKTYLRRYGELPSKFSALGYEMMLFFGSNLQTFGKYFQQGLKERGFVQGLLSPGFDYSSSNANSFVPVIQWDGDRVIFVTRGSPAPIIKEQEEN